MSLVEGIARGLEDEDDRVLAREIFGTATPELISDVVLEHVEVEVAGVDFFHLSVGAVLGLSLTSGERVVLKVFNPRLSSAHVLAACSAQSAAGSWAPDLVAPARERHGRVMVTMAHREDGTFVDARRPELREAMARGLYELSQRLARVTLPMGLETKCASTGLFPRPHNALFDFEKTAADAELIDGLATKARAILEDGNLAAFVIGHCDWSAKNLRMDEPRAEITVIYDWDALFHVEELELVAGAARGFSVNWFVEDRGSSACSPSLDDMRAFIADYERTRGQTFTAREHKRVWAHLVYGLAYTARCEHALGTKGTARARLIEAARELNIVNS